MCALSTLLPQGNSGANSSLHFAELAQLVERRLAKAKVAGSNPVFRSIWPRNHCRFRGRTLFSAKAKSMLLVSRGQYARFQRDGAKELLGTYGEHGGLLRLAAERPRQRRKQLERRAQILVGHWDHTSAAPERHAPGAGDASIQGAINVRTAL